MKKLLLFLLMVSCAIFSQEKLNYVSDSQFFTRVDSLSESAKYKELIELFDSVNPNDSLSASVNVSNTYYKLQLKEFQNVIAICDQEINNNIGGDLVSFYINKAVAFVGLNDHESALDVYSRAIQKYPMNGGLYKRRGSLYKQKGQLKKAYEDLKKSFLINPYDLDLHLSLGDLFYSQNKLTQALMMYNFYLLLSPDGEKSFKVLNYLNETYASNSNNSSDQFEFTPNDKVFKEIDVLIANRIALNDKYKTSNKVEIAFVKQNHLFFSMLNNLDLNDDFINAYYVPIYKWIISGDRFDDFVYTTCFSIENEKYKKIVAKKEEKVKDFYADFKEQFKNTIAKRKELFRGKLQEVYYEYEESKLVNIGQRKEGKYYGAYNFYSPQGTLIAQGNYDANEKRVGKWVWYNKYGAISEIVYYVNGKPNGEYVKYYDNGNLNMKYNYKDGLIDGSYKLYNRKGALIEVKNFIEDKLEGKYVSNYPVGASAKEYEIDYKEDNINGEAIQFYANKTKAFEANFINNKREGIVKNYFLNGVLEKITTYVDGDLEGDYKDFFINGKLYQEGIYLNGELEGIWKLYFIDGKPYQEIQYSKGKLDGHRKEYSHLGHLYEELEYKNDQLNGAMYYDKKGNILSNIKKEGGVLDFKGYGVLGNIKSEGLYDVKGGKTEGWKFYDINGVLESEENYVDGTLVGESKYFYKDGGLKNVLNYKEGELNGYSVEYYVNGQIASQGYYLEGVRDKEWRYYYKDGTIERINYFHKGELNGVQKYYNNEGGLNQTVIYNYDEIVQEHNYNEINQAVIDTINYEKLGNQPKIIIRKYYNGAVKSKSTYVNGVLHGEYVSYHPNGKIQTKGIFVNDGYDGLWEWYNTNGELIRKANYLLGNLHGDYTSYYPNGKKSDTGKYVLGSLHGKIKSYAMDGKTLTDLIEYSYGERNGETIFYGDTGNLQLVRYYDMGVLIGYSYLGKDGKLLEMIPVKNETAKVTTYYDNGNKARVFEIKNGEFVNNYEEYFYNGKVKRKSFLVNGKEQGEYLLYFSNGKVKLISNYLLDELHGEYKEYYSNGVLKEEFTYRNDKKSGTYKKYNNKGEIIEQGRCIDGDEFEEKI